MDETLLYLTLLLTSCFLLLADCESTLYELENNRKEVSSVNAAAKQVCAADADDDINDFFKDIMYSIFFSMYKFKIMEVVSKNGC